MCRLKNMRTRNSRLAKIMRPRGKNVRTNTRNSAFPRALLHILHISYIRVCHFMSDSVIGPDSVSLWGPG